MITAKIVGTEEVIARINKMKPSLRDELKTYCMAFGINTVGYIRSNKLSGQVLHHRKGRLKDSINSHVEDMGERITATIGTNVEYAKIHEYGGQTKPHLILPKKEGGVLHFFARGQEVFTRSVNHPGSRMPERSFLRSTLADKKEAFRQGLIRTTAKVINQ